MRITAVRRMPCLHGKNAAAVQRTGVVYATLGILDAGLLFLPFPLAMADMAMQGGLANTSYTLRETATKSYVPADMRARLGAIFNMMISIAGIGFTLLAGTP